MYLAALGTVIRQARKAKSLTRAQLARRAGVARTTLNRLENGVLRDLGVRKLIAILEEVGQSLAVLPAAGERGAPDYLRMACTSASTSFRERLRPDELVRILLTGKVPRARRPPLRVLLEELPVPVLEGVVRQVEAWSGREKVLGNLAKVARALGTALRIKPWRAAFRSARHSPKPNEFSRAVGRALRRAAKRARTIARMHGTPIYIWKDGKVVAVKP